MPLFSLGQVLLIRGPRRYGTHEASLFSQNVDKCFWTTMIPTKVGAVTSWETPVVGPSHFGTFPLTFLDDLLYACPLGFQFLRQTHSSPFLTQRTYSCSNFVAIS